MKQKDMERIPINYDLLRLITPQGIDLKSSRVQTGDVIQRYFIYQVFLLM